MKKLSSVAVTTAGFLSGTAVGAALIYRRLRSDARPRSITPSPIPPPPDPGGRFPLVAGGSAGAVASDATKAINIEVASAVLDVADRLTSAELCRRLGAAVGQLPGVGVIDPAKGSAFDPAAHSWDETCSPPEGCEPRSVAATKVPGLVAPDGTIVRKARVAVFE